MKRGFTLIEIIIVIIIVGILAAVGISQYSKMVEKARGAEARMALGQMRKLAYEYWLATGAVNTITLADLHIGSGSDQAPDSCRSSHYFFYTRNYGAATNDKLGIVAYRCTSGGKTPQYTSSGPECLALWSNFLTGEVWWEYCPGTSVRW